MSAPASLFKLIHFPNGQVSLEEVANGQAMHSWIGAEAEAKRVYVDASNLARRLESQGPALNLWDIGMGTASNAIAALECHRALPLETRRPLRIQSFETQPEGLALSLQNLEHFAFLKPWHRHAEELLALGITGDPLQGWEWRLQRGDWDTFESAESGPPEVIFFDMYSPKVVPELWSEERFVQLRSLSGPTTILCTYSVATWVRAHLLLAGWKVGYGQGTGAKSGTTVASTDLGFLEKPLDIEWFKQVERSQKISSDLKQRVLRFTRT